MIIYVVAARMWFIKHVRFLLGHPVESTRLLDRHATPVELAKTTRHITNVC